MKEKEPHQNSLYANNLELPETAMSGIQRPLEF